MAEKKVKQPVRVPTEKQVTLLEKLMVHELEDVQKKALAIVLSIWKKKTIQEISYIIPELTEKQIRYTMKRYHANPTQYLQAMYDRWSKQRMVHELRSAHDKWAKRHQNKKSGLRTQTFLLYKRIIYFDYVFSFHTAIVVQFPCCSTLDSL